MSYKVISGGGFAPDVCATGITATVLVCNTGAGVGNTTNQLPNWEKRAPLQLLLLLVGRKSEEVIHKRDINQEMTLNSIKLMTCDWWLLNPESRFKTLLLTLYSLPDSFMTRDSWLPPVSHRRWADSRQLFFRCLTTISRSSKTGNVLTGLLAWF